MNVLPEDFTRIPYDALHAFVSKAGQTVGLPEDKANLLAQLLTENDMRGVFSHGTQQITQYAILMRDGKLNNNPHLKVVRETPLSLMVDGDGGLGYFPCHEGTRRVVEKAEERGMAAMMTWNHGHFGAAGIYARMTLGHDLLAFVTSGHQLNLQAGKSIYNAAGGSPMAFSAPTVGEDPLVLDFGTMHDLYSGSPHRDEIARMAPGLVLRSIGLGMICQSWGYLLAGMSMDASQAVREYDGAYQGSLVVVFQISLFADPDHFKQQMDEYVRRVHALAPLEGIEGAYLPGGPEAEQERICRSEGIPVSGPHREGMEKLAGELGIETPWQKQ